MIDFIFLVAEPLQNKSIGASIDSDDCLVYIESRHNLPMSGQHTLRVHNKLSNYILFMTNVDRKTVLILS